MNGDSADIESEAHEITTVVVSNNAKDLLRVKLVFMTILSL
jgi:hypothetical protein